MKFNATPISYRSTGLFSAVINDYIETKGTAQSFVNYAATKEGYKKAIEQRASFIGYNSRVLWSNQISYLLPNRFGLLMQLLLLKQIRH